MHRARLECTSLLAADFSIRPRKNERAPGSNSRQLPLSRLDVKPEQRERHRKLVIFLYDSLSPGTRTEEMLPKRCCAIEIYPIAASALRQGYRGAKQIHPPRRRYKNESNTHGDMESIPLFILPCFHRGGTRSAISKLRLVFCPIEDRGIRKDKTLNNNSDRLPYMYIVQYVRTYSRQLFGKENIDHLNTLNRKTCARGLSNSLWSDDAIDPIPQGRRGRRRSALGIMQCSNHFK